MQIVNAVEAFLSSIADKGLHILSSGNIERPVIGEPPSSRIAEIRASNKTFALCPASNQATASPTPLLAPVITTTFPVRLECILSNKEQLEKIVVLLGTEILLLRVFNSISTRNQF